MLGAQSTTKDDIRAEHKLHSISSLFISQVIIPEVFFFFLAYLYSAGTQNGNLPSGRVTYFILRAYTGTMRKPQPAQEKSGEVLEKMQVNGLEG